MTTTTSNSGYSEFVLKLHYEDQYKVKLEDPKEMHNSAFYNVYKEAFKAIDGICNDNNTYRASRYRNSKESIMGGSSNAKSEFNNVVVFTGERGSGKTSAMLNVAGFLAASKSDRVDIYKEGKEINTADFHILPPIDPSAFEPIDSLLTSILSSMYRYFSEEQRKNIKRTERTEDTRNLEKAFQKMLEPIRLINQPTAIGKVFDDDRSSFEVLEKISGGASIRQYFNELVSCFLQWRGWSDDCKGSQYLVVCIDDLDLNMGQAYKLAEDIRKYLMQPQLILLIAMKLDQLKEAIEIQIMKELKHQKKWYKRDADGYVRTLSDKVETMANLYMEKIFPASKATTMPSFASPDTFFDSGRWQVSVFKDNKLIESSDRIEKLILTLVNKKTDIILFLSDKTIHPLVPKTLREIHHFIMFLVDLPDPKNHLTGIASLQKFRQYFLDHWISKNLQRDQELIIKEIADYPFRNRNKYLTGKITYIFNKLNPRDFQPTSSKDKEITNILNSSNRPENISLGDVIAILHYLEQKDSKEEYTHFYFSIRLIYTVDILIAIKNSSTNSLYQLLGGEVYNSIIFSRSLKGLMLNKHSKKTLIDSAETRINFKNDIIGNKLKKFVEESGEDMLNKTYSLTSLFYFGLFMDRENDEEINLRSGVGFKYKQFSFRAFGFLFWSLFPKENLERFINNVQINNTVKIEDTGWFLQMELLDYIFTNRTKSRTLEAKTFTFAKYVKEGNPKNGVGKFLYEFELLKRSINKVLERSKGNIFSLQIDLENKWSNMPVWEILNQNHSTNSRDDQIKELIELFVNNSEKIVDSSDPEDGSLEEDSDENITNAEETDRESLYTIEEKRGSGSLEQSILDLLTKPNRSKIKELMKRLEDSEVSLDVAMNLIDLLKIQSTTYMYNLTTKRLSNTKSSQEISAVLNRFLRQILNKSKR